MIETTQKIRTDLARFGFRPFSSTPAAPRGNGSWSWVAFENPGYGAGREPFILALYCDGGEVNRHTFSTELGCRKAIKLKAEQEAM